MAEPKIQLVRKYGSGISKETGEVYNWFNYYVRVPVNSKTIDVKLEFEDKVTKQILETLDVPNEEFKFDK